MRRSLTRFARALVCALVLAVLASACTGCRENYESEPVAIDDGVPRGLAPDQELVDAASTVTAAQALPSPTPDSLSCLPTRLRAAQLLLPLARQQELPGAQTFAADGELGGIGLVGESDAGLAAALEELQQLSPIPVLVAAGVEDESVPSQGTDVLATLSPEAANGLLRFELELSDLIFTDALNTGAVVDNYGGLEGLELAFVAGVDVAILGSLADLTPALDHLVMRANEDPAFASIIESRAARVLAAKGQQSLCER